MRFKYIFIYLFLQFNFLFAQSISSDIGKSYPISSLLNSEWDSDYTFGLSTQFLLYESFHFKPFFNYCSFKFDTVPTSEGPEVRNFKFNNHNIVTFGVLIKHELSEDFSFSPYFQGGLGYMISNLENINYTWGQNYEAAEGGIEFNSITIILGIGWQVNHFNYINPFFEINSIIGFPDNKEFNNRGLAYLRFSLGVKFTLISRKAT